MSSPAAFASEGRRPSASPIIESPREWNVCKLMAPAALAPRRCSTRCASSPRALRAKARSNRSSGRRSPRSTIQPAFATVTDVELPLRDHRGADTCVGPLREHRDVQHRLRGFASGRGRHGASHGQSARQSRASGRRRGEPQLPLRPSRRGWSAVRPERESYGARAGLDHAFNAEGGRHAVADAARANHHSRPEIGSHWTKYGSRDGRRRQRTRRREKTTDKETEE